MENLLTVRQLSERAQVSRQTIYLWRKAGMPTEMKSPPRFKWMDCVDWINNRKGSK